MCGVDRPDWLLTNGAVGSRRLMSAGLPNGSGQRTRMLMTPRQQPAGPVPWRSHAVRRLAPVTQAEGRHTAAEGGAMGERTGTMSLGEDVPTARPGNVPVGSMTHSGPMTERALQRGRYSIAREPCSRDTTEDRAVVSPWAEAIRARPTHGAP